MVSTVHCDGDGVLHVHRPAGALSTDKRTAAFKLPGTQLLSAQAADDELATEVEDVLVLAGRGNTKAHNDTLHS